MIRYVLMLVLLVTAVVVPTRGAPYPGPDGAPARDPEVPESVTDAARQGRFWRASRILGKHLAALPDTAPETILLASRLSAGWGDWRGVSTLLEGRGWLDEVERGAGWALLGRSRSHLGRPDEASEALARYIRIAEPGDADRGRAQVRRGLELGRAGRPERALAVLDSAAATLPWFEDWIHLFAAEVAAAAGDTAEVRRRLTRTGPDLVSERGWPLRMEAARASGDGRAARQAAMDAARDADSAGRRAFAWVWLGDLRLEAGDTALAREAYRSAIQAAPGATVAVDAARGLSRLGPSAGEWRTIATTYLRHGNQARAIDGFERYLEAGIGEPGERAQVRLQLGKAHFDARRYAEAERGLLQLAADSVPPRIAAEALYVAGRSQYRQGRSAEGQKTLIALSRRFPDQEATARGLYLLADLKHDDLELDDARTYYRRAADAAPALNEAGLALMRLGGLAFLEGDYQGAASIYEEYRAQHPDGRRAAQATYWAARAHAQLGREAEAARLLREVRRADPVSYYGMRAAELLGADVMEIPLEPAPPGDAEVDSMAQLALRRVDLLGELDRREDLVAEVERLRRHFQGRDGGDYALAEALNARGHTLTGLNMGWDIRRREGSWNPRLLRIIYPFPFRDIILAEAQERGVDPYLVAGLIRRESAFNPTVSSSAGAIGLMQIMPETGRGLAQGAGLRGYTPEILKQPEINVHLGVRYLSQLLRRFGEHHLPTVLSAYNAGPHRAVRWQDLPEHEDPELFTERIPYSETRDYVRHVLFHRAIYQALYPDAVPAPADDR
ncbi:MAG TPA: transglycosylase SLT domain-containing protein [Longimicrobiales bacterium]|nr:transglycosylase SLT domain-containing protein [Longimicrobiales bacterium]